MIDALLMRIEPLRRHIAVWQAAFALEKQRPKTPKRNEAELSFLPSVLEIVETPASPVGRSVAAAIMALCVIAVLWACFGKLDIHATATGRIIAGGKTKPVAASETSIVKSILVNDGDHVEAGQPLIELDPAAPDADFGRIRREWLEQLVTAARLKAMLAGQDDFKVAADVGAPPDLIALHRQQLRQALADHAATQRGLEQERYEKEAEQRSTTAEIARLEETVPLLAEQAEAKHKLSDEGYVSRTEYLKVEQELIDRRQELESTRHKLAEAENAVTGATDKLAQAEAQFRADGLTHLADAEQKAASLAQDLAKATDRRQNFTLNAPVSGVVQQLAVHAPGAVITPAEPVLMIVPGDEGVAAEVTLPNKDVGFVLPGQSVEIKVEAFPFTRYGTLPGVVLHVSGDAVNPDGEKKKADSTGSGDGEGPVYAVLVKPLRDHILADGRAVPLSPGMAVTAEIKTGQRRVIEYILDPLMRYQAESFRER